MTSQREGSETDVNEAIYFLRQLPGLWAGRTVPTYPLQVEPTGAVDNKSEEDLRLLLDTASRQLDRAEQQLEQIRQRSQFLFTVLLALIGLTTVTLRAVISEESLAGFVLWAVSAVVLTLALLGSTAVIVNKKVMGELDANWLSNQSGPWLEALAKDSLESVLNSRTTVANQLTYFRDAALLTIVGTVLLAIAWGVAEI